jgi:hypothetical protein
MEAGLLGAHGHLAKFHLLAVLVLDLDQEPAQVPLPAAAALHVLASLTKQTLAVQRQVPIALVNILKCSPIAVIHATKHATV